MWNFWTGALIGWIAGELGLCFVLALVSDHADRRQRRELPRAHDRDDRGEADSA